MVERKSCEEDLFCGIKRPKDVESMADFEKKHTPVIDSPEKIKKGEAFEVVVEVGKFLKHPSEVGHFIQWIELYSGDTFLSRVELTPALTDPRVGVPVRLTHAHPLRALARCNLHGIWEGSKKIAVV